jgi:hypothetical protein
MTKGTLNLAIPFELLVEAISSLDISEKRRLRELIDEQIFQEEEEFENDPIVQAEVQTALDDYEAGDYVTLDQYIEKQQGKSL